MENKELRRLKACFDLARLAANADNLEMLHSAIEKEIAAVGERIDRAHESGDEWFVDIVIQDECNNIEELLGLAFVASQRFISAFSSRIVTLSKVHCKPLFSACEILKIAPPGVGGTDASEIQEINAIANEPLRACKILKIAPRGVGDTDASEIQEINAIANYWKHHEEWPVCFEDKDDIRERIWDIAKMGKNYGRTAKIANSLGIVPSSSGNLRSASEKFGVVSPYTDLRLIRAKLCDWANDILEKSRVEVGF